MSYTSNLISRTKSTLVLIISARECKRKLWEAWISKFTFVVINSPYQSLKGFFFFLTWGYRKTLILAKSKVLRKLNAGKCGHTFISTGLNVPNSCQGKTLSLFFGKQFCSFDKTCQNGTQFNLIHFHTCISLFLDRVDLGRKMFRCSSITIRFEFTQNHHLLHLLAW